VLTSDDGIEQHRVMIEDGDLFVLGPCTNVQVKHAELPVKDEKIKGMSEPGDA
jgi:hypothetical protein